MTVSARRIIGLGVAAVVGLTTAVGFIIAGDAPAGALTITVDRLTSSSDSLPGDRVCSDSSGQCSLRAAIEELNAIGGQHSITLPSGRHALGGPIDVSADVSLQAVDGSAPRPIIDLGGLRGFEVEFASVSIDGVDMENGVSGADGGTAIRAINANLVISSAAFRDFHSDGDGGAIQTSGGTLSLFSSEFDGNTAINGGAVSVLATDTQISLSSFRDNGASGGGGAIFASFPERFDISGSGEQRTVFERNTALGQGGAKAFHRIGKDLPGLHLRR